MRNPEGESDRQPLRTCFHRRLKLEFHGSRVTSDAGLLAYSIGRLARFNVPRYLEYIDCMSATASNKMAKHLLTVGADPRHGNYDRVEGTWRK